MITTTLMLALVLCAMIQRDRAASVASVSFAISTFGHDVLLADADGLLYYGSAAFADLVALCIISRISTVTTKVLIMAYACIACITLNFGGWVLWMLYLDPAPYNLAFILLYSGVIIALIKGDRDGLLGGNQISFGMPGLFSHANPSYHRSVNNQETA